MFTEYLADAIRNIKNNKLRTALTMLGIVIGIASVIAVLTIGEGMVAYVQNEVGGFSGNVAALYVDTSVTPELITPEDLRSFSESIPGLKGSTYQLGAAGVVTGARAAVDVTVNAGSAALENYTTNKVQAGRYFTDDEVDNHALVCVITQRDAEKLFGTANAVGRTVELNLGGVSRELIIIGVKANYSEAILTMMDMVREFNAMMEMPYTTMADMTRDNVEKGQNQVLMFGETGSDIKEIMRVASRIWRNRHEVREDKAIMSESMADVTEEVDQIFGAITAFMSFVAAISLLVGGIGVMNIMLVSVTERTREIGIRKSIGARTGAIMVQFLAESAIISLMGGIVGVILGIVVAAVACHLLTFALIIKPSVVLLATFFSMTVGILFGLHPARRAAKMRPIDALRF